MVFIVLTEKPSALAGCTERGSYGILILSLRRDRPEKAGGLLRRPKQPDGGQAARTRPRRRPGAPLFKADAPQTGKKRG